MNNTIKKIMAHIIADNIERPFEEVLDEVNKRGYRGCPCCGMPFLWNDICGCGYDPDYDVDDEAEENNDMYVPCYDDEGNIVDFAKVVE